MRIALVTDSHLAPLRAAEAFNANWRAVREFIARAEADLTIHLGDITVDGATDHSHYTHALSLSEDWPTPIRFLPGNHDIGDNPPGPGMAGHHLLDLARLAAFRDTFGPDYWAQDAGGWWLIALNAQLFGSDARAEEEQWDWLRLRVDEADARPVLLLLHKPLCYRDTTDARPHGRYVPFAQRQRLLSILKAVDLRLVLSGHAHQHLDHSVAGVRHVWLPSTAFFLPDRMQDRLGEKITGVGILELAAKDHCLDIVCPHGVLRHDALDHPIYPEIETAAAKQRSGD